jgi:FeS assembly SUF system regulator
MLRVTKIADYGIVMLTYLAAHPGTTHNARDMARATRLPLPVVSKVLKLLAREGVLESHRGTKGGYGLARHPRDISVAEIIRALEGPIAVTECTDRVNGDCDFETRCPVRTNWQRINTAIHQALEGITLEEMAQPLAANLVQVARIAKSMQAFQVS